MEKLVLTATPLEGYNSFRVSHFWECACGEANTHLPTEESCEDCGTLRENGKPALLSNVLALDLDDEQKCAVKSQVNFLSHRFGMTPTQVVLGPEAAFEDLHLWETAAEWAAMNVNPDLAESLLGQDLFGVEAEIICEEIAHKLRYDDCNNFGGQIAQVEHNMGGMAVAAVGNLLLNANGNYDVVKFKYELGEVLLKEVLSSFTIRELIDLNRMFWPTSKK